MNRFAEVRRLRLEVEAEKVRASSLPIFPIGDGIWIAQIPGAGGWKGKTYTARIVLPPDYPARPPVVTFVSPIRPPHPNVWPDGRVCLNVLNDSWDPTTNLVSVFRALQWLFENPNYDSPANRAARRPLFGRGPGSWVRFLRGRS